MQSVIKRVRIRSFISVCMSGILLALTAPLAAAADSGKDAERDAMPLAEATRPRRVEASADSKTPTVLYAAFDALSTNVPSESLASRRVVNFNPPKVEATLMASIPLPSPLPQASTAPMTAKEKFG